MPCQAFLDQLVPSLLHSSAGLREHASSPCLFDDNSSRGIISRGVLFGVPLLASTFSALGEGDSIVPTFWGATQNVELLAKEVVAKLLFFAGASLQNAFLGTQAGMRSILADFVEDEVLSMASLCVLCHGRQHLRLWVMKGGEKLMVTASCPWSCLV